MVDRDESIEADIAELTRWLDDPVALAAYVADFPYLRTLDEARDDIKGMLLGLEDIRAGRVVPHDVILRDIEERRRRVQPNAAE